MNYFYTTLRNHCFKILPGLLFFIPGFTQLQAQAPVLNCPPTQTITLDPGDCEHIFDFNITATDNTDPNPVITQLAGPPSGTALMHGTTTNYQFRATDFDGNSSTCSFDITVNEFPVTSGSLSCNTSTVQVSLDEFCTAVIGADMILEGNSYGCYLNYTVEIVDQFGNNIGNTVNGAHIGQILDVTVLAPNSNSCWGRILIEDKLIPDLLCGQYTIPCTANTAPSLQNAPGFPLPPGVSIAPNPDSPTYDPSYTGPWTVSGFDACGPVTLSYSDSNNPAQCQPINNVITRNWTAIDASGNSTSCSETINLQRATFANFIPPSDYDGIDEPTLPCDERENPLDNSSCGPSPLGWNTLPDGHPYAGHPDPEDALYSGCPQVKWFGTGTPGGVSCGDINFTFSDTRINICPGGASESCYKILRRWTLQDWCTGQILFHTQIIKVDDDEGPEISGVDDLTISTDVWRCEADWYPSQPWLYDNCSSNPLSYTITSNSGTVESLPGGGYRILDLPIGDHQITYSATDCCGNTSEKTITLTVIDDVPPSAVCDAHTVVSLTTTGNQNANNLGLTKIFAHTFDDGSFDNCSSQVWFKAIRMDEFNSNDNDKNGELVREGDWASLACNAANGDDDLRLFPPWYQGPQSYFDDYVKFCCTDIENGPIMVVFRVFDVDPTPYTFGEVFRSLVPSGESPADYAGVLPEEMMQGGALYGHFNDCMVEVTVQDKLPPKVYPPDNITVTCDFWFEFDPDNPNDYTDELDAVFGKVVPNEPNAVNRDSINIRDRVCPAHPRFSEFGSNDPFDDPCYDDQYDIYWGKDGFSLSNCDQQIEQEIIPDLHCGRGTILRRWRASDGAGNWSNLATQTITIIDCKEWYVPTQCWRFTPKDVGECDLVTVPGQGLQFRIKLIEWPCDVELTTCQGPGEEVFKPENLAVIFEEDRRPRFDDDNCSLMTSTYTDEVYVFVDSSCVKIFRDWKVIDWCLYEDFVNGTYSGDWSWEYQQVIKLLNSNGPVFGDCSDQSYCGYGDLDNPNNPQCVGIIEIRPDINDDCTPLSGLRIDYKVDIDNDGSYERLGYSGNQNNYPFPNPANLPVRVFPDTLPNADGNYPVGTHRILWGAEDGCGNFSICEYLFTIEDCKPPTAYCEIGVSTISMPANAGGYIDIWASDFNLNSNDNCTESANLIFSFSDDINDRSRRLTCVNSGTQIDYTVYVWDEAGNYSSCLVAVLLNDCSIQGFNITGTIRSEEGDLAEEVSVLLGGFMTDEQMTGASGAFNFLGLPDLQNYIIEPEKDMDPRNGVTTFDLVLISKHILGIQSLGSPYKMIAADVNKSGTITTFDMVNIRKLILFIDSEFSQNTSWRFVPADFLFTNPTDPFSSGFPEVYSINGLDGHQLADFIAIKTGDVNGSARTNLSDSEDRSLTGSLAFNLQDAPLQEGGEYVLDFNATDFASVLGYQFALSFDTDVLEFVDVQAGVLGDLTAANFGTALLDQGILTSSWNGERTESGENAALFSLRFRAKKNAHWSEVIRLSDRYTAAEAYTGQNPGELEVRELRLDFGDPTFEGNEFELFQNQPNPFAEETLIRFYLPESGLADLTLHDLSGKVLTTVQGNYPAGMNKLAIPASSLPVGGVYYYTLRTASGSKTMKMIHLK